MLNSSKVGRSDFCQLLTRGRSTSDEFLGKDICCSPLSYLLRNGLESLWRLAQEGFIHVMPLPFCANIQTFLTPFYKCSRKFKSLSYWLDKYLPKAVLEVLLLVISSA